MTAYEYNIFPLGVDALTIDFGSRISIELNDRIIGLAAYFDENPFPGLIETVPAYASLTIFYDLCEVRKYCPNYECAFDAVEKIVETALEKTAHKYQSESRIIEIPVDFSADFAPDLEFVAASHHLSKEKVVEIFTARTYRVFMLGFMPGFAYMGEVDERIATPRKESPRLKVPKGSVGLAGSQTGIYPFDSPGGWQLIGHTDFELFAPDNENPCALEAGDLVKFHAI